MKALVLGASGMLGHKVFQTLLDAHPDTGATVQGSLGAPQLQKLAAFRRGRVWDRVDALDFARVEQLLRELRPEFVINCIGLIKQRPDANVAMAAIALNALLPHQLARAAATWGGRVIHFSTDCVFSGRRGAYTEDDLPDADDLYGRTKALGEVTCGNALTLRTSIIGRELHGFRSLLEWFLSSRGKTVRGFTRVMYSGVTTNHLARIVVRVIDERPSLSGLYQVASSPISKHDLLLALRDAFDVKVGVEPDDREVSDRTMNGDRFVRATGWRTPSWAELVAELGREDAAYRGGR